MCAARRPSRPVRLRAISCSRPRMRSRPKSPISSSAASRSTSVCRWRRDWAADRPMPAPRSACWPAPIGSSSMITRLQKVARRLGADVPVCVDPRPRRMRGIGEVLSRAAGDAEARGGAGQPGRRGADQGRVRDARPQARRRRTSAGEGAGAAARRRRPDRVPRRGAQRSRARRHQAPAGDRAGARGAAQEPRLPTCPHVGLGRDLLWAVHLSARRRRRRAQYFRPRSRAGG